MKNPEIIYNSFRDELEKIAGTGSVRIGIRPFRAQTMAAKTGLAAKGSAKFFRKTGGINPKLVGGSMVTGGALALYGDRKLKKLKDDYQMARQMRRGA